MHAFILGNGKSRLQIDPNELKKFGKVYACNRAYQEFTPDVLVSVDKPMAEEIQRFGYSEHHPHYTRPQNVLEGYKAIRITKYEGYSSGPVALSIAAMEGARHLYMIGMDLGSDTDKINNLYAGTDHYKQADAAPTAYSNWVNQIVQIMKDFPERKFYHVSPLFIPDQFNRPNFETLTLSQFRTLINK